MKCPMCHTNMTQSVGTHTYRSLPGVVLVGVPVSSCPNCGEEVIGIPAMEQLNRLLRDEVVNKPERLTGHEVRFLRKFMGLGKDDLGAWLDASPEEIEAWEDGARPIPEMYDRFVRVLALRGEPVESYPAPNKVAQALPKGFEGKVRFQDRWEALVQ